MCQLDQVWIICIPEEPCIRRKHRHHTVDKYPQLFAECVQYQFINQLTFLPNFWKYNPIQRVGARFLMALFAGKTENLAPENEAPNFSGLRRDGLRLTGQEIITHRKRCLLSVDLTLTCCFTNDVDVIDSCCQCCLCCQLCLCDDDYEIIQKK